MKKLQLQASTTRYVTLNEFLALQKNNLSKQYQEVKKKTCTKIKINIEQRDIPFVMLMHFFTLLTDISLLITHNNHPGGGKVKCTVQGMN